MAIDPNTQYPGQVETPDVNYPYGGAKNETTPSTPTVPGSLDGTPFEKAMLNDIFGFQQALLSEAGIVPSGNAETALVSQYLDAIKAITTPTTFTAYVGGGAMTPGVTNGATPETVETTNGVTRSVMTFAGASDTIAGFSAQLKDWDLGTITTKAVWKPKTGAVAAETVVFDVAAVAIGDSDLIDVALGTAQQINDTVLADTDLHISAFSNAITVGGAPADGDQVFIRILRDISAGTMTVDCELLGVEIEYGIA